MTMVGKTLLRLSVLFAFSALLGACTQPNTADQAQGGGAAAVAVGVDRFLLFPNPVGLDPFALDGGTFETNTNAYATAYYRAIDPTNAKDTIDKWKTANGFTGVPSTTEHLAVFRDVKDLGYGRRMTGRINPDGSVAFYVENYNVAPGGSTQYSSDLNVDAAIRRDTQWHVGTNAIEWSSATCVAGIDPPNCDPTVKFAKYYNFSSADGARQVAVDLDGKGLKAMPGPCITCHGGRGDPLTPADVSTGNPRFPLVENSVSRKRGDVEAKLHGMNVDSFSYSTTQANFAKSDLQPFLKDFNQWILCTYPTPAAATVTGAWGTCNRPIAGQNEWQGTAGPMIEAWYGGPGMPQATFQDTYVPSGWAANASLYTGVVAPYCRTCHILRGTKNQDDLDFMTLAKFQGYADRIKVHVFDRGNMPLALIPHSDFWNSAAPLTLATFIDTQLGTGSATSASGAVLMPGRPIADPGPNRMVRTGANAVLTAENSLFASTFSWTLISGSATIANANSMIAILRPGALGNHVVRLTVGNAAGTDSRDVTITADDNFPDPLNIRFAHVKNLLQNVLYSGTTKCTTCHNVAAAPLPAQTPPIWYNNFDRNGSGGAVDATDDAWFLKALGGRVNLTEIGASPLLRKPSGNHHNGGTLFNLADTSSGGGLSNYSILYNWILAGMQPGGVAANLVVNNGTTLLPVTFSGPFGGPYGSSDIPVDGSTSIGATNFLWSASAPSSFANALAPVTTLKVFNVGTYVVQVQVDDGVLTDTAQRTVVVSEAPITASFTPPTGTTVVTFSGNPGRGNIALTSTSAGSPASCQWQVTGPANATLDGVAVPTVAPPATITKSCGTAATLNVPAGAIGGTYQVQLTASTIGSSTTPVHGVTVGNGTPVVSNIVANGGINPAARSFTGGNPANGTAATASVSLNGNGSSGVQPLSFLWSITSQPDPTNGAASFSSTTAAAPTLTVRATGSYTVRLQVTDAAANTAATTNTFSVTPANGTTFATMTGLFVNLGCTGCHSGGGPNPANNSGTPPDWTTTIGSDGSTLWRRAFQRVVVGNPGASLLLQNPNNTNPHGGGCRPGFGCDATGSANATTFSNWITDGGPPGN
jgi:hypothetical protein